MKIHKLNIGLRIEQKMNELGVSKSELARRSGIANQNINRVLERTSIDTDKLFAISEALDYNFFQEFVDGGNNTIASGTGSVAMSGANNSNYAVAGDAILAERIKHLEELLAEKERLIKVYEKMMEVK